MAPDTKIELRVDIDTKSPERISKSESHQHEIRAKLEPSLPIVQQLNESNSNPAKANGKSDEDKATKNQKKSKNPEYSNQNQIEIKIKIKLLRVPEVCLLLNWYESLF